MGLLFRKETPETKRIQFMLNFCMGIRDQLRASEEELIVSFQDQWNERRRLSDRQVEILEEIYGKY